MLRTVNVHQTLAAGKWFKSLDLKDTHFHVPVHPEHRKFLRFTSLDQAYKRADTDRQHIHSVSYQPSRWDKVSVHPEGSPASGYMGPPTLNVIENHAPTGHDKYSGRLSVMTDTAPRGVEITPSGGLQDLGSLWQGTGRPVNRGSPFQRTVPHWGQTPWFTLGRTAYCTCFRLYP